MAAIAIPRFSGLRVSSAVKADGATARTIVSAARVYETEKDVVATLDLLTSGNNPLLEATVSATGATFLIGGGGSTPYTVTFTPDVKHVPYNVEQTVKENEGKWEPLDTGTKP